MGVEDLKRNSEGELEKFYVPLSESVKVSLKNFKVLLSTPHFLLKEETLKYNGKYYKSC